ESAPYQFVAGCLARAQGDEAGQERHFAAALAKEPGNETYQYNLAAVRIKSPDPQKNAEARATLEHLVKSAPFRAGSLRALLNDAIQHSNLEAADRFAQELQLSPQVTFSDDLLCLNIYGSPIRHMRNSSLDRRAPMRNPLLCGTMPSAPAKKIPSVKFDWLVSLRNGSCRTKRSNFGCASPIIH